MDRFACFDTALGRCALVWGEHGITGVELPGSDDAALRRRIRRAHPGAEESAPTPAVAEADRPHHPAVRGRARRPGRHRARHRRGARVQPARLRRHAHGPAGGDDLLRRGRGPDRRARRRAGRRPRARAEPVPDRRPVPPRRRRGRAPDRLLGAGRDRHEAPHARDRGRDWRPRSSSPPGGPRPRRASRACRPRAGRAARRRRRSPRRCPRRRPSAPGGRAARRARAARRGSRGPAGPAARRARAGARPAPARARARGRPSVAARSRSSGRQVGRVDRDVDADPEHRPALLRPRLDEHARELAPAEEDVVRPLDLRARAREVGDGEPGAQRQQVVVRAQHERAQQRAAGRRGPRPALAPAPGGLDAGGHERPVRRARPARGRARGRSSTASRAGAAAGGRSRRREGQLVARPDAQPRAPPARC